MKRAFAAAALGAALVALVMGARAWRDASRYLSAGRAALEAGDEASAIRSLAWSAHATFFGVGPAAEAARELETLAARLRERGDRDAALAAYQDLHAALYAGRSALSGDPERLARLRAAIAELRVREGVGKAGRSVEDYLAATTRSPGPGPSVGWSLAASLSFLGWIGAALAFVALGMTPELRIRPRPAAVAGLIFLGSYATWVASLLLA